MDENQEGLRMITAVSLVMLAGCMNGTFAVPMKFVRAWQWEHAWLAWSILAMLVFPLAIARLTVLNLGAVYRSSSAADIALVAFFGMAWGVGTILFGLGINRVGIALSFGIVLGTSSAFGAMVPMLLLHRDRLLSSTGLLTAAGVAVILGGVALGAHAGLLRAENRMQDRARGSFRWGLATCFLSGIASSFMSLALNVSTPISRTAERFGTSQAVSVNAVWPVLLAGGLVVNVGYCGFLILRHSSAAVFARHAPLNIGLIVAMALLFSASNLVYGLGANRLGSIGLVLGWPMFMGAVVLAANLWGFCTGEWLHASRRALSRAVAGCLLLVAGIWIVAQAGGS
jgi:L-rhamnose-H+ transport protein